MIIPEIINGIQCRTRLLTKDDNIQIREMPDGSKHLLGRAIVFNSLSESFGTTSNGKDFREKIAPTAIDECLREYSDIFALDNHDSTRVLGRTAAGNLMLTKSEAGLDFDLALLDTTFANDMQKNVRAGIITGCSFGFTMKSWDMSDPDEVDFEENESMRVRIIKKIDRVFEITLCAFPAYPLTNVNARSQILAENDPALKRFLTEEKTLSVDDINSLSHLERRLEINKLNLKLWNT